MCGNASAPTRLKNNWPKKKLIYLFTTTDHINICNPGEDWTKQLVAVVGSTFTGKTHWLRHLFLSIHKQFHYGVVFSSTDRITGEYDWLPPDNRYDSWEDRRTPPSARRPEGGIKPGFKRVLACIMSKQEQCITRLGSSKSPCIFIIIDDPMGAVDFHHCEEFRKVAGQLRKYNITMFILLQYVKYLSPMLRNGCHRIIIFQNTEEDMVKCKELIIGFKRKGDWVDFVTQATKRFGAVMYNRVSREITCVRAPTPQASFKMSFA